jgi:hypothetical protein
MAWSASGLSRQLMVDMFSGVIANTGSNWAWKATATPSSFKVALYDNTITPSRDDTAAAFAYAGASWSVTGGATGSPQVYQAVQWPQAGIALATGNTTAGTGGSGIAMFDAADLASGTACTISNAYGCLVYNDSLTSPVADQGLCFNSFATGAAVTNGTFCVDDATEILTRRGWLRHDQVRAGDTCLTLNTETGTEEWQPVGSVHVFTDGPYHMIRLDGHGHSSVTTPDHRWPAVTPEGGDTIGWHTTRTLPPDAQLITSGGHRTGKVADFTATEETAALVWCVETPARTWYARRADSCYFTGNTIQWSANGVWRIT